MLLPEITAGDEISGEINFPNFDTNCRLTTSKSCQCDKQRINKKLPKGLRTQIRITLAPIGIKFLNISMMALRHGFQDATTKL